jgi:hypothetical protein
MDLAALRAGCDLGILFRHFVQEVRKRLTTAARKEAAPLIGWARVVVPVQPLSPRIKKMHTYQQSEILRNSSDGARSRHRIGSLRRIAVTAPAAIRA